MDPDAVRPAADDPRNRSEDNHNQDDLDGPVSRRDDEHEEEQCVAGNGSHCLRELRRSNPLERHHPAAEYSLRSALDRPSHAGAYGNPS